jgi:hypothetical protein
MSEETVNVPTSTLMRIQQLRKEFKDFPLKKSGFNKHMNFEYFELKDFLPTVTDLLAQHRLTSVMTFADKYVVLHVFSWDEPNDTISLQAPRVESDSKGQKAIQVLGADITYYRRYLYGMLVDLVENDMHDASLGGKAEGGGNDSW